MRFLFRYLSFTLFLFVFSPTQANNGVKLILKSGLEVSFMFSYEPCLVIGKELLIKTNDGNEVSYEYSAVRNISILGEQNTNIEDSEILSDSALTFKFMDGTLSIFGLPVGEHVSIYILNGQHLETYYQKSNTSVMNIPLKFSGIYIVRTSTGISYKIKK